MAEWTHAAAARLAFADMFESLDDSQRNQPSMCDAWTATGVLCHLTSFVETSAFGFVKHLAKGRFDFDIVSQNMADVQLARPVNEVLADLRSKASQGSPMPGFPEAMTIVDTVVHTQDVRRPLGLDGGPTEEHTQLVLDFLTTHKKATQVVNRRPIDGVRLEASDSEWTFGTGAVISGTGEALIMGLANRPVLDDLNGDGLANWKSP